MILPASDSGASVLGTGFGWNDKISFGTERKNRIYIELLGSLTEDGII